MIEKVLIGCDGVNSVVAKWLGFKAPAFTGRSAVRGCLELKSNHSFEPKMSQFAGEGVRAGIIPCDDKTLYWFFTWTPSAEGKSIMVKSHRSKSYHMSKFVLVHGLCSLFYFSSYTFECLNFFPIISINLESSPHPHREGNGRESSKTEATCTKQTWRDA